MKRYILTLTTGFLLLTACSHRDDTIAETHQTASQLTHSIAAKDAYLIDVRTPKEYAEGHLKYADNMDFKSADFKNKISRLDKNKPVYLYCKKGGRSKKAADTLETMGFTKVYSIGGLEELSTSGLKVEE
jgi:phage shock protein E